MDDGLDKYRCLASRVIDYRGGEDDDGMTFRLAMYVLELTREIERLQKLLDMNSKELQQAYADYEDLRGRVGNPVGNMGC